MELNELVIKAKKGDTNAVDELIKRFTPFILKTCKTIFINGYENEDLIQIGYLTLLKAIKNYDLSKVNKFTAYVTCAIKNNYYYEIRQKAKLKTESSLNIEVGDDIQLIDNLEGNANIEASIIVKENVKELKYALEKLTSKDRELIIFVFFNNGRMIDYAKLKDIKYMTCVKRKNTALKKLKKHIDSYHENY